MCDLISIIVPVYNAEKTLDRCISSLIHQSYRNLEIILVNDGSRDDSLRLCTEWQGKDNRIKIIDKPNGGVSSARNAGLKIAVGEYIMFCDSDDWAEANWCEVLIKNYLNDSLVMCGTYVHGNQKFVNHELSSGEKPYRRYKRTEFQQLKLHCINVPWNKIYKRSIIEEFDLHFYEQLSNGEDIIFILEYLSHISGDIYYLDCCVFNYVWPNENSLSKNVPLNYLEQCDFYANKMITLINELGTIESKSITSIYTDIYNQYYKALFSLFMRKHTSIVNKLKLANVCMSSNNYQYCCSKACISPNRIFNKIAKARKSYGMYIYCRIKEAKIIK